MSPHPRVSVIIPHLNEPDDLRRCLDALERQRDDGIPFEIIVVDNGSRVLPEAVCSGVRLERESTPGPGPARNRGAAVARADILAFIDADCIVAPGWIREMVARFDAEPEVHCLAGDIRVAQQRDGYATAIEAYEHVFSYRVKLYVERDRYAATGNMAVRRSVFEAVGPFGGIAVMEDTDWGRRATALGFRIAYAPGMRVYTPPCRSFEELTRRWDRHIAHDFERIGPGVFGMAKWLARSLAIAASPAGEIVRILRSDRLATLRERGLAFGCLARVRLYRARKMLGLALTGNAVRMVESWNRD